MTAEMSALPFYLMGRFIRSMTVKEKRAVSLGPGSRPGQDGTAAYFFGYSSPISR
jgi:hypothetical protein